MSKAKQKPSISIIGPGRLGQALAIALQSCGYPIVAFVGRRATYARSAAKSLDKLAKPFGYSKAPTVALGANDFARIPHSDLILIATPDDALEETSRHLAASETGRTRSRTVLHTSGALSSELLTPLAEAGFHTGSLHPLVSVSEPRAGAQALRRAFYCIEGDKVATRIARSMVSDLGGKSFSIEPKSKALYHAAAVMASGHFVALFDVATEMLVACRLSKENARAALLPLVESAVKNLQTSDAKKALTGTFARGDLATIEKHLEALSRKEIAEAPDLYKLLGLRSLQLAEKNGMDRKLLSQLRKRLESADV